jgi:hypothetical protein
MKFDKKLEKALDHYAPGRVKYVKGWKTRRTGLWRGKKRVPEMIMHHHTAGAATSSTNPKHKGNQPGANNGVVNYCIARHNSVPYCNAVVDRDGTIFITAAYPVWHAGKGDFTGTRWERLGIGRNEANSYTFGVEVVSKGAKRDFTLQQKIALRRLDCALREASGWKGFKYRIANHKDWAPDRKVDTRYPWQYFRRGAVKAWRNLT